MLVSLVSFATFSRAPRKLTAATMVWKEGPLAPKLATLEVFRISQICTCAQLYPQKPSHGLHTLPVSCRVSQLVEI